MRRSENNSVKVNYTISYKSTIISIIVNRDQKCPTDILNNLPRI